MPGIQKFDRYKMPADMSGKSFLDVGCWEGENCVEALKRGARRVVGIDLCTSEGLSANLQKHDFEFVQMGIFSEKWLQLDGFDVVLCSGVLYHVENPLSLIARLHQVAREALFLETVVTTRFEPEPAMLFYPESQADGWPSRWWAPNRPCLISMLETMGFREITTVWERKEEGELARYAVRARPIERSTYRKLLPRREQFMSMSGGKR